MPASETISALRNYTPLADPGKESLELACPLLFIYGRRKPFMFHSPAWEAGVAAQRGCEVIAMDTGHWVMREEPAAVNEAILRWLA